MELQPRDGFKVSIRGRYQAGKRRKHVKGENWNCRCVNCGLAFVNRVLLRKHYAECQHFEDFQILETETSCEQSISVVIEDATSGATRPLSPEDEISANAHNSTPSPVAAVASDTVESLTIDMSTHAQNKTSSVVTESSDSSDNVATVTSTHAQNNHSSPVLVSKVSEPAENVPIITSKHGQNISSPEVIKISEPSDNKTMVSTTQPQTTGTSLDMSAKSLSTTTSRNAFPTVPHKAFLRPFTTNYNFPFVGNIPGLAFQGFYQMPWPRRLLATINDPKKTLTTESKVYPRELYAEMTPAVAPQRPPTVSDVNIKKTTESDVEQVVDLTNDNRDILVDKSDQLADDTKSELVKAKVRTLPEHDASLHSDNTDKTEMPVKTNTEIDSKPTEYEQQSKRHKTACPVIDDSIQTIDIETAGAKVNDLNNSGSIPDDITKAEVKARTKSKTNMYPCLYCDLKFKYISRCLRHEKASHANEVNRAQAKNESPVNAVPPQSQLPAAPSCTCVVCGVTFPTLDHLSLHSEVHRMEKPKARNGRRRNPKPKHTSPVANAIAEMNTIASNIKTDFPPIHDVRGDVIRNRALVSSMGTFDVGKVINHMRNNLLCLQNSPLAQHIVAQGYKIFPNVATTSSGDTFTNSDVRLPLSVNVGNDTGSEPLMKKGNRKREPSANESPLDLSIRSNEHNTCLLQKTNHNFSTGSDVRN